MPDAFLHIGLPKTATSSLQVFFAKNAAQLSRSGVKYPWTDREVAEHGLISSGNGATLARFGNVPGDARGCKAWNRLRRILAKSDENMLISSEFFCGWTSGELSEIVSTITEAGYSAKCIVYLRDQADILVGHYYQALKRRPGFTEKPGSDFTTFAKSYASRSYLDFEDFLTGLARVFGPSNLIVRPTKNRLLKGGSIFSDFLASIGCDNFKAFDYDIPVVNLTPRQRDMSIRAALGIFNPSVKFSDSYLQTVAAIYANGGNADDDVNYFVDTGVVDEWRQRYYEANERVCGEWFGANSEQCLARKSYPPRTEVDLSALDPQHMVMLLGGLLVSMSQRVDRLEAVIARLRTKSAGGRNDNRTISAMDL